MLWIYLRTLLRGSRRDGVRARGAPDCSCGETGDVLSDRRSITSLLSLTNEHRAVPDQGVELGGERLLMWIKMTLCDAPNPINNDSSRTMTMKKPRAIQNLGLCVKLALVDDLLSGQEPAGIISAWSPLRPVRVPHRASCALSVSRRSTESIGKCRFPRPAP